MALNAGTVVAILSLESKDFESGLNRAKMQMNALHGTSATLSDKIKAVGNTITSLGKGLTLAVTAPLVALGTTATRTFTGFDDAMRQVRATMNASEADTERLTAAAKEAGATTRYTAAESASALNYLALAGYDASEAIESLPKVLRLAQAGGLDLAYASDLLTDSMAALGKGIEDMDLFADQMAVTSQKANTNVAQLGEAILTVGGTAKVLKGDTVELNTVLGILADSGIKGSEAGTALRRVLLNLTTAEGDAARTLKELGVSVYDAEGNMRGLNEVFADLNGALANLTQEQRTKAISEIFDSHALASAEALLANCGARYDELSGHIMNAKGAAEQMAETMEGGIGGSFRSLKSAVEGIAIAFGEKLAPTVQAAADWVTELARKFSGLSNGTQETIVKIAALVAAAGPLLIVGGKVISMIGSIGKMLSGPAGWIALAIAGAVSLTAALGKITDAALGILNVGNTVDRAMDRMAERLNSQTLEERIGKMSADVTADVSVTPNITVTMANAYELIKQTLTDGKADTDTVVGELETVVRGEMSSARDDVEKWMNEEIAKLDVNSAEYDTQVANIRAKGADLTNELTTLESATIAWILSMQNASIGTVQANFSTLDEYHARVQEILAEIEAADRALNAQNETRVQLVKAGKTTDTATIDTAFAYVKKKHDTSEAEIRAQAAADIQAYQDAYKAGTMDGLSYSVNERLRNTTMDQQLEALRASYTQEILQMFSSLAEGEGLGDEIEKLVSLKTQQSELRELLGGSIWGKLLPEGETIEVSDELAGKIAGVLKISPDEVGAKLTEIYQTESNSAERLATGGILALLAQSMENEIAAMTDEGVFDGLGETFLTAMKSGVLDPVGDFDLGDGEGNLDGTDALLTMLGLGDLEGTKTTLKDAGKDVGSSVPEGMAEGVTENTDWINDAVETSAGGLEAVARAALESKSPSKVFKRVGNDIVQGMIDGVNDRKSRLYQVIRNMAKQAAKEARKELESHSPSKVFFRIGQDTGEGFALGIDDKLLRAESSMRALTGENAKKAVQNAPAQAAAPGLTIHLHNPTIRSDEDIRKLGRELNRYQAALTYGR